MPEADDPTVAQVEVWDEEARVAFEAGDYTRARQLFEQVLAVCRRREDPGEVIFPIIHLTEAMRFAPGYDPAAARRLLDEALARLDPREEDPFPLTAVQTNLAVVAMEQGDYATALPLAQRLLAQSVRIYPLRVWGSICGVGLMLARMGRYAEGLRLYAAGMALRERQGTDLEWPGSRIQQHHEQLLAGARAALGPVRQAAVEQEGRTLSEDQAVALALALTSDE